MLDGCDPNKLKKYYIYFSWHPFSREWTASASFHLSIKSNRIVAMRLLLKCNVLFQLFHIIIFIIKEQRKINFKTSYTVSEKIISTENRCESHILFYLVITDKKRVLLFSMFFIYKIIQTNNNFRSKFSLKILFK